MIFIYRTLVVVIMALGVSLLANSHHYFFLSNIKNNDKDKDYYPVVQDSGSFVSYDQAALYWPKVRAIYRGSGINKADPFLLEHKEVTAHAPNLSEVYLATILRYADGDISEAAVVSDYFSTFVLFVILFIIFNKLAFSYLNSISAAAFFIFSFEWAYKISIGPKAVHGLITNGWLPYLSRDVNLAQTIVPFVIFLFFYVDYFKNRPGSGLALLLMFFSASMLAYFNFFMWTMSFALISFALVASNYNLKNGIKFYIRYLPFSFVGVALILAPYFLNAIDSYSQDGYTEFLNRFGVYYGHDIHILTPLYVVFSIFFLVAYRRTNGIISLFIFSAAASLLVLKNLQFFVGYTVQAFHWGSQAIVPFSLFISIIFFFKIAKASKTLIPLTLLLAAVQVHASYVYTIENYETYTLTDRDSRILEKIKLGTNEDDVIFAPWNMSALIVNYTGRRVFLPIAPYTYAPPDEILHRLGLYYCYYVMSNSEILEQLRGKYSYYSIYHMDDVYRPARLIDLFVSSKDKRIALSEIDIQKVIEIKDNCIVNGFVNSLALSQYRADHLVSLIGQDYKLESVR